MTTSIFSLKNKMKDMNKPHKIIYPNEVDY